jgi:hypothetical protein
VSTATAQASPTSSYVIPPSLVRDLLVATLLSNDRPPARSRLEHAVGRNLAGQLLVRHSPRLY